MPELAVNASHGRLRTSIQLLHPKGFPMPATLEQRSGNQPYVDCDEYIDIQLSRTQSQIKSTELLLSASAFGLAVLAYVLSFVVLDQWIIPGGFSVLARSMWLSVLLVGGGSWLTARILIPWFKTVHELYAAKMIESADPSLKSSVLNLVDMQMHGISSRSPGVLQAMEKRAAVQLSKVDVEHAVDRKALMRLSYALLAMLSACCLYILFSPKDAFSSVHRLLLPAAQAAVATQTSLTNITPEDTRMVAGEFLTVEVDVLGQVPPDVKLLYTTEDHEYVDQPVDMQRLEEGAPRYRGVVSGEKGRGLMQSIVYRIEAGDARSREFRIDVVAPPSSQVDKVDYVYPAYTKLDPKNQPGGAIEGWEGTKVSIAATASIPVTSALVVMTETDDPKGRGEEIRMSIHDGKSLTADWTLNFRKDGTFARYYHIDCTTAVGESDPRPTVYTIKIQPDQRPDVSLLHPAQDLERPANATVPLLVKASDPDFMLRFVTLRVEKGGDEIFAPTLLDVERPTFEGTFDLELSKLTKTGLLPGDEILYWIEARDNKQPHGNRTTTQRLKIKITEPVKPEEAQKQLQQDLKQQREEFDRQNPEKNGDARPDQPKQEDPKQQEKRPDAAPMKDDPNFKQEPGKPKEEQPGLEQQPDPQQNPNPGEKPDKPEADQQPMPGAAPQPADGNQPGAQPGAPKPDQKQGKSGNQPSSNGKDEPEESSTQSQDPDNQGKNKGRANPPKKQGPADDQTALQKFIQNEQAEDKSKPQPEDMDPNAKQPDSNQSDPMKTEESERPSASKTGRPQQKPKPQTGGQAKDPKQSDKQDQPQPDQTQSGAGQGQGEDKQEQPDQTVKKSPTGNKSETKPGKSDSSNKAASDKTNSDKTKTDKSDTEKTGAGQTGTDEKNTDENNKEPGKELNKDDTGTDAKKTGSPQPKTGNSKTKQSQPNNQNDPNKGAAPENKPGSEGEQPAPKPGTEEGMPPQTGESKPGATSKPGKDPKATPKPQEKGAGQNSPQPNANERSKPSADRPSETQGSETQQPKPGEKNSDKKLGNGNKADKNNTEKNAAEKNRANQADQDQNSDPGADGMEKAIKPKADADKRPMNAQQPENGNAGGQEKPMPGKKDDNGEGAPMPEPEKGNTPRGAQSDPMNGTDNPMPQADAEEMPPKPKTGKQDAGKPQAGKPGTGKVDKDAQQTAGKKSAADGQKLGPNEKPKNSQPGTSNQTSPDTENSETKNKPAVAKNPNSDESGQPMPAEDDSNATKRKADGTEKGLAEGQDKPEDDAPRASSDVVKKPGSKRGAMKDSQSKDADAEPTKQSSTEPKSTKTRPDGTANEQEPQPGTGAKSDLPREKRPGTDPSQNEPAPGKGKANQKSQKPDSGENGGGTPQDQGTEGSKEQGRGDDQKQPGDQSPGKTDKQSKAAKKPGPGEKTQPGQTKPGESKSGSEPMPSETPNAGTDNKSETQDSKQPQGNPPKAGTGKPQPKSPGSSDQQPSKSGEQKSEQDPQSSPPNEGGNPSENPANQPGNPSSKKPGKPGSKPGKPGAGGQGGQPSADGSPPGATPKDNDSPDNSGSGDKPANEPGNAPGNGPGQPNGQQPDQLPPAEQDAAAQAAEEKANEEYARKASSLVLKKLKKELDRGEVDPKLLDELGWTKDDMQRFVKRLEKQLQDAGDESNPESAARRKQFEETLKAVGLSAKTKKKTAKAGATTRVDEAGARRIPVPAEYQELYEEYNKDLAKPAEASPRK
jgi:collagen type III alpha